MDRKQKSDPIPSVYTWRSRFSVSLLLTQHMLLKCPLCPVALCCVHGESSVSMCDTHTHTHTHTHINVCMATRLQPGIYLRTSTRLIYYQRAFDGGVWSWHLDSGEFLPNENVQREIGVKAGELLLFLILISFMVEALFLSQR